MKAALPPWIRKFKFAVGAGVVAVLCLAVFALRFSRLSDLEEELQRADDDVRRMQRNIENAENLATQLAEIERLTDRIADRTVVPADAAVNKAYFYQYENPGLKIESVEQRTPPAAQGENPWKMQNFETVEFTIVAEGSFTDVLGLAHQIRGGQKLVRVTSMSLLPGEGIRNQRRIELTIEALAEKPAEREANDA